MSKLKWEDSSAPVPPEGNRCLVNWEITQLKRVWVLSDGGRIWSCGLAWWFGYYTEAEGSSGERRSTHSHESSVGAGWSSTPACLCNAALPVMDGSTAESAEQVQMARGERRAELWVLYRRRAGKEGRDTARQCKSTREAYPMLNQSIQG